MVKVISYFTKDTGYEKEVENLKESLNRFRIPHFIESVPGLGSWELNTAYKATFIEKCLALFGEPLVFLDADAVVRSYPSLFDELKCDIAVHFREGRQVLSGTVFVNNTVTAKCVVSKWIEFNKKYPDYMEQDNLRRALEFYKQSVSVVDLPPTYTQIFDLMKDKGTPVIEHFQASRRFKASVKRG